MIKLPLYLFLLLAVLLFSCQKEESAVYPQEQGMPESLRGLMLRVSQNPTSIDNMIDSTSCFSIKLPVSVLVNQQQVIVLSEAGYGSVSYILNESEIDEDSIEFIFPITLVLKNFEQITVADQNEMDAVVEGCVQAGADEIECIDFNYPMSFNTYNSEFQLAEAITVNSDQQLYNLLDNMMPGYLIDVIYPVTLTDGLGESLVVNNNISLQNAIQGGIDSCEEN